MLDDAIRDEPQLAPALVQHYAVTMPAMRRAEPALFSVPLDWEALPRLRTAIDRLYAVLAEADVDPNLLGAPTSSAFFGCTATLGELYGRTHYGGFMPLLYGLPADLAYFGSHGLAPNEMIDRYLVAPVIHELSHLHRDRVGVGSIHLDESLAGWLGVHVHRELAYPAPGHDDALYGAPWLAQIGQAVARKFGVRAAIRAHAGVEPLPVDFSTIGWADWRARKTLHLLSNTFDPDPWVGLALTGVLAPPSLASLDLPENPELDRAIVRDALTAMCLSNSRASGSMRTHSIAPVAPIELRDGWLTTPIRGDVDTVAPRYWVPPSVARLPPRALVVTSIERIDEVCDALLAEAART